MSTVSPYESMVVYATQYGAARFNMRYGERGVVMLVASADRRVGPPTSVARVRVLFTQNESPKVDGLAIDTDWPTRAFSTRNPTTKGAKQKSRAMSPADRIASIVFDDSISGRMLRMLALRDAPWAQADFMREYMRRCARNGTSPSGFLNNFGRYLIGRRDWRDSCLIQKCPVIERQAIKDSKRQGAAGPRRELTWGAAPIAEFLAMLTPKALDRAFTALEGQMLAPKETDIDGEHTAWIRAIQNEMGNRNVRLSETLDAARLPVDGATEVSTTPQG